MINRERQNLLDAADSMRVSADLVARYVEHLTGDRDWRLLKERTPDQAAEAAIDEIRSLLCRVKIVESDLLSIFPKAGIMRANKPGDGL